MSRAPSPTGATIAAVTCYVIAGIAAATATYQFYGPAMAAVPILICLVAVAYTVKGKDS